jgi:hypothetical protein
MTRKGKKGGERERREGPLALNLWAANAKSSLDSMAGWGAVLVNIICLYMCKMEIEQVKIVQQTLRVLLLRPTHACPGSGGGGIRATAGEWFPR